MINKIFNGSITSIPLKFLTPIISTMAIPLEKEDGSPRFLACGNAIRRLFFHMFLCINPKSKDYKGIIYKVIEKRIDTNKS